MAKDTLLVLTGIGIPSYSARGLTQTLEPIEQTAYFRRTLNGELLNLAPTQFRLYRSTISCVDMRAPAIDGIWPGAVVTVDCIIELGYPTGRVGSPTRTVVPGSSRVEGSYTFYRPRLLMKVTSCPASTEEFVKAVGWSIELEESV